MKKDDSHPTPGSAPGEQSPPWAHGHCSEAGIVELAEAWFQLNCPDDRWDTIRVMFDQYRAGTLHGENRDNFLRLCSICLFLEA